MNGEVGIETISDTARWVAMYRAIESERQDAHFRDPYARILAGEQGEKVLRQLHGSDFGAWVLATRTVVIDELIQKALAEGPVDTVINLAAGLDTRPYRLSLPSALRWIEVDLPEILSYKERKLERERPQCRLERIALDLSDAGKRQEFFSRMSRESQEVLIITEGFLLFLKEAEVISLARDLHAQPNFRWWVQDFVSPFVMKLYEVKWGKALRDANAPLQLAVNDTPGFFKAQGWETRESRSLLQESRRLKRTMPLDWLLRTMGRILPEKMRKKYATNMSGYLLLEQVRSA